MFNVKNIKIRPTILAVFVILITITSSILIGFQYYFLKDIAYSSTMELIEQTSKETKDKIESFEKTSQNLVSILELSYGLGAYPKSAIQPTLLKKFTTAILSEKFIYSIYVGYDNNSFYEIINLNIEEKLREKFNAKNDERWLVIKIFTKDNKKIRLEQFLDKDLKLKRYEIKDAKYEPTVRPWYIQAIKSDEVIRTAPYLFDNLESYGVTYAKKLENNKAVLGLDISLKSLNKFLEEHEEIKGTKLYLFDNNKTIIASNEDIKTSDKNLKNILDLSMNKNGELLEINDHEYFVSSSKVHTNSKNDGYLSIFIPEYAVMNDSNEKIIYATLIALFFMLLILPIVWVATKIITTPIHQLAKENKKIKNRKYDDVVQIKTPISEIRNLSKSLVSMSSSIQEYEQAQVKLMDSIVELIATTIDAKSKYTAGHCERVPTLTLMIAEEASKRKDGVFKSFKLKNADQKRELSIAAWLHDCGKVTTPIYVVDKATKLETIYNRIHEIRTRFEVIYRDLKIESLNKIIDNQNKEEVENWLKTEQEKLIKEFEFIAQANMGAEFMNEDDKQKVKDIAKREWTRYFDNTLGISYEEQGRTVKSESNKEYLLEDKQSHIIPRIEQDTKDYDKYGFKVDIPKDLYNHGEVYNLTIDRGTLTAEERFKINEHIIMTIKMLEQLPFPDYLKKVPEYAGAHHETLIGTGYPRKLTKEDMSVPARIMAVADVFEALTASDRPYKKAKTLSESIKILSFMVKDKHLDEDIFKLFLESGLYLEYGKKYLGKDQLDEVNISDYI